MPSPAPCTFVVPGKAVPWSITAYRNQIRPKAKVRDWQRAVYHAARNFVALREYDGPMRMDVVVVIQRPKSRSKNDPDIFIPHTVKPDRDNYGKAIQDALVRPPKDLLPLLRDDCTVWVGEVLKCWAPVGVGSYVVVYLEPGACAVEVELEHMGMLDVVRVAGKKHPAPK